ncbi:MAG TPA: hypothetical protein VER04_24410 [Polyangiaceae bacterium]|nr:hypothetical protein [Polyangiaceae bacterium]
MGSVSRRLTKHLSFFSRSMAQQIKSRRAGMSVQQAAAIIAPAVTEGVLLSQRLERAARENNAADPLHFLEYLRRMRRGYDPRTDGPSKLMTLVDEINKFEKEELERRKAAQS